jgi:aldose 1-epimerase
MIQQRAFGRTQDGRDVTCFTLSAEDRISLEILDYGAIVRCLYVPGREGTLLDVVLGYDDISGYEMDASFMGAAIGRYANRIRNSCFELEGVAHHVSANEGRHQLHGGRTGFDKVVWRAEPFESSDSVGLVLEHVSPDGDEGYPGTLTARVTYAIDVSGVFAVDYHATTDRATPLNMTQHSYFNLHAAGNVLDHELTIDSSKFLEIDSEILPTGNIRPVDDTPLDFRRPKLIGSDIGALDEQLLFARGYDHTFVLNTRKSSVERAARVVDRSSGIAMEVFTTEPGMQFYSGNFLAPPRAGKRGQRYQPRSGFCLETQHFPDSPNHPEFPSTILTPGEEFISRTEFRFKRV